MRVGIMQPTYLPWLGYFEMIGKVDEFYFLNNVQFNKKSWQNRNYILESGVKRLLTVPVKKSSSNLILEIEIDYSQSFPHKHLASIFSAYRKAPFINQIFPILEECLVSQPSALQDLNVRLIEKVCGYLEIETPLSSTSNLISNGKSTKLTVAQCLEVGATEFYCANGAREYVSQEEGFEGNRIKVTYQDFRIQKYPQQGSQFIPQLSVIDALFNCGPSTRALLNL